MMPTFEMGYIINIFHLNGTWTIIMNTNMIFNKCVYAHKKQNIYV